MTLPKLCLLLVLWAGNARGQIQPVTPLCEQCAATDLIFILDNSESIPNDNYQAEITFIENLLSDSKTQVPAWGKFIGESVKVGIYVFSGVIESKFEFMEANNYDAVYNYLESIRRLGGKGGTSNICNPLNAAYNQFKAFGTANAPKTLVIFTDGDPNSATGSCSSSTAIQLCNTMKTSSLSVEVLSVAVAGNNGNQSPSNMPVLSQMASTDAQGNPLVYSLQSPADLQSAESAIATHMSCCSCYPNLAQTVEITDNTYGNNGDFLKIIFNNINSLAQFWYNVTGTSNYVQYLVVFSDANHTNIVSKTCTDYNCWTNTIQNSCPVALGNGNSCSWLGGETDLPIELYKTVDVTKESGANKASPHINVQHITGHCQSNSGDCNTGLNTAIANYQNYYRLRIGDYIYISGGQVSDLNTVKQIVGSDFTVISGPSVVNDNGNCLVYQVARALSDLPGCSAQPYLTGLDDASCQYP